MLTTEALPRPSLEQTPSMMSLPCIFSKGGIGINAISLELSNKVYLAARTKQKNKVPKKTKSSTWVEVEGASDRGGRPWEDDSPPAYREGLEGARRLLEHGQLTNFHLSWVVATVHL